MVRKRAHAAFLTTISLAGIAVGVATLLISLALLSGFQTQIKERLMAASPQILIEPVGKNTIDDAPAIVAEAKRLGMRDIEPIIDGIAWGGNEAEHRGRPMRIRSYEPGQEPAPEPTPTSRYCRRRVFETLVFEGPDSRETLIGSRLDALLVILGEHIDLDGEVALILERFPMFPCLP